MCLRLKSEEATSAPASYMLSGKHEGEMTKDQIRAEHDRLQAVLEAYEARALANSIPDHHDGLRQRIAALARKLAETNNA